MGYDLWHLQTTNESSSNQSLADSQQLKNALNNRLVEEKIGSSTKVKRNNFKMPLETFAK